MSKVINISDSQFQEEVLASKVPVLIEFWAEWCGPCKMMAPVLDNISKDFDSKLKVVKMDIDSNQLTPPKYGIRGIPSILLIKGGDVLGRRVGAMREGELSSYISGLL